MKGGMMFSALHSAWLRRRGRLLTYLSLDTALTVYPTSCFAKKKGGILN